MVFNTCFVLRSSSILHLAFRSAILSTLSFEMVLCHPWQFLLVLHDSQVVRNELIKSIIFSSFKISFRPINLFVGVILGYISPKAFHWECCYLWCLSMIQVFSYPLGESSFHLFVDLKQAIVFFVSGRMSSHSLAMFP